MHFKIVWKIVCSFNSIFPFQYQPFKEGGKGNLADRAKNLGLADAAASIMNGEHCSLGRIVNPNVDGSCFECFVIQ